MESGKKEFFFPAFHGELIITPFLLQLKNLRRSILLIKNVLFSPIEFKTYQPNEIKRSKHQFKI